MAQDPAKSPPPDAKKPADDSKPSEMSEAQAAEALRKINEVEEKLEPRG